MEGTVNLGIDGLSPAVHLGSGGSANVFAARRLETGEQVAVKLLRASADSEKERIRFDRERETLGLLSDHEGIVPVIDAGVTDRQEPYLLLPLMQGSLQDRIDRDGALDWESASQLIAEVADTVEFAHSQKVLHRDLKPGNILLDEEGVPRVADFGIAKLMDSSVSKSSKALGTPSFMPPERFRAADATEASDVYGLGATLAALLTGTAPFLTGQNDTDAAVMMRVINEEAPVLVQEGIPERVAGVVTAAMAKEPADRPATAAEFAHMLRTATIESGGAPTNGPVTVAIPRRDLVIPDAPATLELEEEDDDRRAGWFMPAAAAFIFLALLGAGTLFALSQRGDEAPGEVASGDVDDVEAATAAANNGGSGDATKDGNDDGGDQGNGDEGNAGDSEFDDGAVAVAIDETTSTSQLTDEATVEVKGATEEQTATTKAKKATTTTTTTAKPQVQGPTTSDKTTTTTTTTTTTAKPTVDSTDKPTTTTTTTTTTEKPTVEPPKATFSQRIDIGAIGETNIRFRFKTNITVPYTIRIKSGGSTAATQNGTATAGSLVNANVGGLKAGTDYTVQVTLNSTPAVSSDVVSFRTSGGTPPTTTATAVVLQNLRLVSTQATRFQVNYESNICANGSFVIRVKGGAVVGSNAGQASGCTTRHLGIPGFWTPALKPNTTYVISVTVEANGQGKGGGNTHTRSLTVTTAS